MSWITQGKLALALIGLVLFAYGVRANDEWLRWVAVGFLVAAFLLRFLPGGRGKRRPDGD